MSRQCQRSEQAVTDEELLEHLRELEVVLHQPAVRGDRPRLEALLHEEFAEFGRSGRRYARAEILTLMFEESGSSAATVRSQDFALTRLGDDVALLTYKSAAVGPKGELSRHTLRSSLWQRTWSGWRMRFHQGTPTSQ
jgi:hypothetical protein